MAEVNFKDIGKLIRDVLPEARAAVINAVRLAATQAEGLLIDEFTQKASDQGVLAAAWRVDETEDGAEVVNPTKYALFVEEGTRPRSKMPPLHPILTYIARKQGLGGLANRIAERSERWDLADQAVFKEEPALEAIRRRAVAAAATIKRRGTKPRHIVGDSMGTIEGYVDAEIARALEALE